MRIGYVALVLTLLLGASVSYAQSASLEGVLRVEPDVFEDESEAVWQQKNPFVSHSANGISKMPVLVIQNLDSPLPAAQTRVQIRIEDLMFSPSAVAVRSGATIEVANRSIYPLTIRMDGKKEPLSLGPRTGSVIVKTDERGEKYLRSDEFSHLLGLIHVIGEGEILPLSAKGEFTRNNLKSGDYELRVWAGEWLAGQRVQIASGVQVRLDIDISRNKEGRIILNVSNTITDPNAMVEQREPELPMQNPAVGTPPMQPPTVAPRILSPAAKAPAPAATKRAPAAPKTKPSPVKAKPPAPAEQPAVSSEKKSKPAEKKKKSGFFKVKVVD